MPPEKPKIPEAQQSQVIIFASPGMAERKRHLDIFRELGLLEGELGPQGLHVTWVTAPRAGNNAPSIEDQKSEFSRIAREAGLNAFLGFDSSPTEIPNMRRYHVERGGVEIFVIDRKGRLQWRLIDPVHHDIALIRGVVERCMAAE